MNVKKYRKMIPNVIIDDYFYENPDKIRNIYIKMISNRQRELVQDGRDDIFSINEYKIESNFPELLENKIENVFKEKIEKIIRNKIFILNDSYISYLKTCKFIKDGININYDENNKDDIYDEWKAVIFLTPDAPSNSGISFKIYKNFCLSSLNSIGFKNNTEETKIKLVNTMKENKLDETKWIEDTHVGNKYNRIVIFKKDLFYSYMDNFGNTIESSKLYQEICFKTKKNIINNLKQ